MRTRPRLTERSVRERRPHLARPRPDLIPAATERARRAGGPEDSALYRCDCGHAFTAPVSTSVGCPACGDAQDW